MIRNETESAIVKFALAYAAAAIQGILHIGRIVRKFKCQMAGMKWLTNTQNEAVCLVTSNSIADEITIPMHVVGQKYIWFGSKMSSDICLDFWLSCM